MADLNKKNPSVTEDALAIHLDASGNIDRISGHGLAGAGGGGGSMNYYGDDVYIKNTGAAGNIFTLTDSVKVKLDQIQPSYTQGTDIIVDENNTIQVNTNGSANSTGMAFVEGSDNIASGVASHAEGKLNSAMSDYSHIEGYKNIDFEIPGQIGSNHTEGAYNDVSGVYTHIEGHANGASGYGLHVQGGYNRFYINNTAADTTHSDPTDRWNIWGISVEGMANATTAEPYSGTIGQPDFGYIHGGILKVIGNGTRTKESEDPSSETITRSDALIIYRDGSISAAGNISANGVELGAGGGGGTTYQGRKGVNVDGGYIELTQTAYNAVTSISGLSTDVGTLKVASADWNRISAKLDTTAFSTVSGNFLTEEDLTEYATKSDLEIASGELLTTAQYQTDSATFLTSIPDTYALKTDIPRTVAQLTDSGNYYQKTETSSKDELSTEFAKYVTSSISTITGTKQYALTTTGWAEVQVGVSLTANSGINIDNNLINVTLGRNLKFDTYSSVTTEDNISATNYRAGEYDNQYTIVNKYGFETYFSSAPNSAKLTLTTNGLNNTLVGGNRNITANYDYNHLFFKSYDNTGTYSGNYSQVEVKVMQETAPEETQHRSSITLTDYYGGVEHTGLITVEKIAQWDQGGGTSFTGVITAGSISGDGLTNPLGLKTSAEQALTSVSSKVDKPDTTQVELNDKYLIYSTLTGTGQPTGWYDIKEQFYSKSEATGTFVSKSAYNADKATFLTVNKAFVSGTNFDTLGQSRLENDICLGTNWMGVSQSHAGFFKYIDGQNVGDTEISNAGSGIQIEFKPDMTQGELNIINTYTGTQTTTKVINVPAASYTNMSAFDSENGPNYMLRKTANGFDIGAAVINTTALPANVQANAYYFIYEM